MTCETIPGDQHSMRLAVRGADGDEGTARGGAVNATRGGVLPTVERKVLDGPAHEPVATPSAGLLRTRPPARSGSTRSRRCRSRAPARSRRPRRRNTPRRRGGRSWSGGCERSRVRQVQDRRQSEHEAGNGQRRADHDQNERQAQARPRPFQSKGRVHLWSIHHLSIHHSSIVGAAMRTRGPVGGRGTQPPTSLV